MGPSAALMTLGVSFGTAAADPVERFSRRQGRPSVYLAKLRLRDFRCFSDVELEFGTVTLLIGGNGSGKTSVLEAIDKILGAGQRGFGFREEDLAPGVDTLTVDLEIRPTDGKAFTPDEHALFETHVDIDVNSAELVLVRVTAAFEEDGSFRSRAAFLKSDGAEDGVVDIHSRDAIGFFYLPAARDARRELDDRGGMWSRLASLLERAHDPSKVEDLSAQAGRELVAAVLGQDRLDELGSTVRSFVSLMAGDGNLEAELRATSIDFRTLLRRASLMVGSNGELSPLDQHSTGLQTLALFGLFRAYLETAPGHLLAAGLEEPEIHLAPHVARSLVTQAAKTGSQVIFTSHSPAITSAVSVTDIRVLQRGDNNSEIRAIQKDLFDTEELARLHRELKTVGTEFLFARAVLLCEGASELGAIPEFAAKEGIALDRLGVSLVPVGGSGFRPFLKLLGHRGFGIPYAVICDNDQNLRILVRQLLDAEQLPGGVSDGGTELTPPEIDILNASGIFAWSSGDLEAYLVDAGGYPHFEQAADFLYGEGDLRSFRDRLIEKGEDHDEATTLRRYAKLRRVRKPELAAEAAQRFEQVPEEMARLVGRIARLAAEGAKSDAEEGADDTTGG